MASTSMLLHGLLRGGQVRFLICDTTEMTREVRDIHRASNTCTVAIGRMIAGTAMMGSDIKSTDERLTVTIKGGGPAGTLCAVAMPGGRIKATIDHPEVELPLRTDGKFDVGGALGRDGQLTVLRTSGFGEPYQGWVALASGEVAEDFAMYYLSSEQIPTLCALGVRMNAAGVEKSGGVLLQAMPDCPNKTLDDLDIRSELFAGVTQLLCQMSLEEIVDSCFHGMEPQVLETCPLELRCDCSREMIERVLLSMGRDQLQELVDKDDGCEVECHFCKKKYSFDAWQLERLLSEGTPRGTVK